MPDMIRSAFTTSSSVLPITPETDYTRYVVGLSVVTNGTITAAQSRVNLGLLNSGVVDLYGDYNSYGAMGKSKGATFTLPLSVDNPYYEVSEDDYFFISGGSSIAPISGILIWYKEFTGAATLRQLSLTGVGI